MPPITSTLPEIPTIQVLNLDLHNLTLEALLDRLAEGIVFTPNIDHMVRLQTDKAFFEAYQKAEFLLCDSRIIQLLSKLGPMPSIVAHLPGSEVFPAFCAHHQAVDDPTRIFLLGGTQSEKMVALKDRLNQGRASDIIVGVYVPPFGFEQDPNERQKIHQLINKSGANTLAIGVGSPKQELWIVQNQAYLPDIKLYFAVGKTLDFMAGVSSRAPKFMSKLGLEWAYRLFQEPKRLAKRYLKDDLPFFIYLLQQWRGKYKNPWSDLNQR